jgi:hypothetical protein
MRRLALTLAIAIAIAIAAAASLTACKQGSLVVVSVTADQTVAVPSLSGRATVGEASKSFLIDVPSDVLPPEISFGIELGPDRTGTLTVELDTVGTTPTLSTRGEVAIAVGGIARLPLRFNNGGTPMDLGPDLSVLVSRKYVASQLIAPLTSSDFAADLVGSGSKRNQFGALAQIGNSSLGGAFDLGTATSLDNYVLGTAVRAGNALLLIEQLTSDPAFANDGAARSVVRRAVRTPTPKFDGTDVLLVASTPAPASFDGALATSVFTSTPVPTTRPPGW